MRIKILPVRQKCALKIRNRCEVFELAERMRVDKVCPWIRNSPKKSGLCLLNLNGYFGDCWVKYHVKGPFSILGPYSSNPSLDFLHNPSICSSD